MSGQNFVCVHGHFYQPPRENPFTGLVEDQPTAAPYPNWNERITEECYRANVTSRILGDDGEVADVVDNYEWISFDFGPTLFSWLQEHAADTYEAIVSADAASARRFGGHGSAMAHAYNHTILPLSNSRDKKTQVRWGVADFEHRFGRRPEGMWLPETAVDLETLGFLAEEGIRFTVLSPYQAASVRLGDATWEDVVGGGIDTRVPYRIELPGGSSIAVFFYNGPLSQEIAFNGVLEDGRALAKRLVHGLGEANSAPLLSHVATDGETYGHHHRFGEMALAAAIREIERDPDVSLTNYAQFREMRPPELVARIIEGSSWSCAHGLDRWRENCGCSTGLHPDWDQEWRTPLRAGLDYLRDRLTGPFEDRAAAYFDDPWQARDAFVEVLLGGDRAEFMRRHGRPDRSGDDGVAIGLLETQHRAMLMYTSCGWFFDDIGGIEAVLVLRHAGRVIELARRVHDLDLEMGFLELLAEANSNLGGTGADVYRAQVEPYMAT